MSRAEKQKMVSLDDVIELEPDLTAKSWSDPLDVFRGGVSVAPPGSFQKEEQVGITPDAHDHHSTRRNR